MRISIQEPNPAFILVQKDSHQTIFLDANILIAPDSLDGRGKEDYDQFFIQPLFSLFRGLSIHEAVYHEIAIKHDKTFADRCHNGDLDVRYDQDLTYIESSVMKTHIDQMEGYTRYHPTRDNSDDRGEVMTLAYMATKGYPVFATRDAGAIRLVEQTEMYGTGLDEIYILHMFELIYYIHGHGGNRDYLQILYRILYRHGEKDKMRNPDWETMIQNMDEMYASHGGDV